MSGTRFDSPRKATAPPSSAAAFAKPFSSGHSLDAPTQTRMSAQFGHDFSSVRVHTDSEAVQGADALGASAYTVGNDIAFRSGQYSPDSRDGERLLAHELTHVVQHARNGPAAADRRSHKSDGAEREAESAAEQALAGESVQVQSALSASVSCFDPGYNDVQNDFWNTKSTLGSKWGNVADSAINTVWDGIGAIPEVGSLLSTGVDVAKAGYSEGMSTLHGWEADLSGNTADRMRSQQYDEAAGSFMKDAAVDATGLIPGYGTYQSVVAAGYDGARTIDLATGGDPNATPSSGDLQKNVGGRAWNAVNPPAPAAAPGPNQAPDQPPPGAFDNNPFN